MRIALAILLALHGAIHLMGFLKWSGLGVVPQLTGRTLLLLSPAAGRVFGWFWLLACLTLATGAALLIARSGGWWVLALSGVVLSQALVVLAWPDAKFGTLANLLILVPVIAAAAHVRFEKRAHAEVRALLARSSGAPVSSVAAANLQHLPVPVQSWLEGSGTVGRERVRTVRLKQRGELRASLDGAWMPAQAEQYFSIVDPGFVWMVDATMLGFLPVTGRDRYADGAGEMLIRAASLVTVAHANDPKIAHGAMLRFLAETVWFPSAALSPFIEWERVDGTSAKATMRQAGLVASAMFTFGERGRVLGIHAERYLGGGKDAKLTPWRVSFSEWRAFDGVEIPSRGDVVWKLPAGDFSYYRWEIVDLEYDRSELYHEPQ